MMYLKAIIRNLTNQSHSCSIVAYLVSVHPIFRIAAVHCSDQEAADKEAWAPLHTRASILNAHTTSYGTGQPHLCICVCARACT
jgi:hypothetical protein